MLVQTCRHFSVRTHLISGDAEFMLQIPFSVEVTALHIECNRITFRNATNIIMAGMYVLANRVNERYLCGWYLSGCWQAFQMWGRELTFFFRWHCYLCMNV